MRAVNDTKTQRLKIFRENIEAYFQLLAAAKRNERITQRIANWEASNSANIVAIALTFDDPTTMCSSNHEQQQQQDLNTHSAKVGKKE